MKRNHNVPEVARKTTASTCRTMRTLRYFKEARALARSVRERDVDALNPVSFWRMPSIIRSAVVELRWILQGQHEQCASCFTPSSNKGCENPGCTEAHWLTEAEKQGRRRIEAARRETERLREEERQMLLRAQHLIYNTPTRSGRGSKRKR